MPVTTSHVTVTTSATQLAANTAKDGAKTIFEIRNTDATIKIYLGGSGVTSANGFEMGPASQMEWAVPAGDTLYAVAASASVVVDVASLT
jgi:hypothetical protein